MIEQKQEQQKKQPLIVTQLSADWFKGQLKTALPRHMTPDRIARIALTELRKVPKLMQCEPKSFLGAIMQCAQLGLEPGNSLGHAYLIPYENRKQNIIECQLIIGYRGMIDLSRRSGQVISLSAQAVYENDEFHFEYGINEKLTHIPARENRGKIIAFYAIAKLKDGGYQFEVLWKSEIDKIKEMSKTSKFGPWVDHYEEMGRKTVVRRLFKYLPVSIEMQQAITVDEQADAGIQDNSYLIDGDYEVIDEEQPKPQNKADALASQLGAKAEQKDNTNKSIEEVWDSN